MKSLRQIKPYVAGAQPQDKKMIKINTNENAFPPSPGVLKALASFDGQSLRQYSSLENNALRNVLAEHLAVDRDQIIVGNGSDDILALAFLSFFNSADPILFPDTTYGFYKVWADLFRIPFEEVPFSDEFEIVTTDYVNRLNGGIVIANPNAPTGMAVELDAIEALLQRNTESVVVVDEAYYEFFGETVVDWIHDYEQLIVLRTLSKAFALAGARIGYGIAGTSIMDILYRIKPPYNLNVFSQIIGALFLEKSDLIQKSVEKIKKEREYLSEKLREIEHIEVFPSAGNFILIRTPFFSEIMDACKKEGISLRSFPNEVLLQNCIRISIGERKENDLLFNTIQEVVR